MPSDPEQRAKRGTALKFVVVLLVFWLVFFAITVWITMPEDGFG